MYLFNDVYMLSRFKNSSAYIYFFEVIGHIKFPSNSPVILSDFLDF